MPMPKPIAQKPRSFPKLAQGDGSLGWDAVRRKVTLQHIVGDKRYVERADTTADAIAKRDARRAQIAATPAPEHSAATVADMLDHWAAFRSRGKAPATVDGYRYAARHITRHIGTKRAADVTAGDVEAMLAALIDEDYGHSSLRKIRGALGDAYAHGIRHGFATTSPVVGIAAPRGAVKPRPKAWLDAAEFDTFERHLIDHPDTITTALLFQLLTGCRPGEVIGLRWDAVDLDARRVEIRSAVQRSNGGRTSTVVDTLKTSAARRTLNLPAALVTALRRERVAQNERRLAATTWRETGLVFTNDDGSLILGTSISYHCRKACAAAGVRVVGANALRHTCASIMLERGATVPQVAKQLGHTDLSMVTETYGHAMVDVVDTSAVFDRRASGR